MDMARQIDQYELNKSFPVNKLFFKGLSDVTAVYDQNTKALSKLLIEMIKIIYKRCVNIYQKLYRVAKCKSVLALSLFSVRTESLLTEPSGAYLD